MSRISVRGTYLNSLPLNAISAYSLPNLENDEQLAAELNVAGIKVLLADIVYDLSQTSWLTLLPRRIKIRFVLSLTTLKPAKMSTK